MSPKLHAVPSAVTGIFAERQGVHRRRQCTVPARARNDLPLASRRCSDMRLGDGGADGHVESATTRATNSVGRMAFQRPAGGGVATNS